MQSEVPPNYEYLIKYLSILKPMEIRKSDGNHATYRCNFYFEVSGATMGEEEQMFFEH